MAKRKSTKGQFNNNLQNTYKTNDRVTAKNRGWINVLETMFLLLIYI
jgi:hypothetical protein